LSVRAQTGIGDKGDSQFGWTGEQFHDLHRQTLQLRQILRVARRYENNVQVRTIANLAATEFAQPDHEQGRFSQLVLAQHYFESVLQAGISKIGQLVEVLFEAGHAQDIA